MRPDQRKESRNGFDIVIQDVRTSIKSEVKRIGVSLEVWNERLNTAVRVSRSNVADR